jgi:hypothetical protein
MTKPIVKIVNSETGEEIEREMNAAEFAQYEADQAAYAARLAEAADKTVARQAVLDRLGLTEEEAQLILGGSN